MSASNVPTVPTPTPGHPQGQQAPQQQPVDSISRVRSLVWQLKEVLSTLMKVTANCIGHGPEQGAKSGDGKSMRFDKPLEEFFSLCNQIELHLKTIGESVIQQRDGNKYFPFGVNLKGDMSVGIDPPNDNLLAYSQYISTVKAQINYCKQVQEILSEGIRKINHQEVVPQQSQ